MNGKKYIPSLIGSQKALVLIWLPIALISLAHYVTPASIDWLHDVLRRLYYVPIITGAFLFGLRGALAASLLSTVCYLPHAFFAAAHHGDFIHHDPTGTANKVLEVLLYNLIALVTGLLAEREFKLRAALELQMEKMKAIEAQMIRAGRLQSLGELTAGLAHEIKNPLASLKASAAIIADEIAETSPRRRMVIILSRELDRMEAMLERFLSFARPGSLLLRPVKLDHLITNAIALLNPQAAQRNVRFNIQDEQFCPVVEADPDKMAQVFLNILLNALQASPDGGIIAISFSQMARPIGDFAVVSIADHGPGIPKQLAERIYDPFFSTKDGGTGLGLSIANRYLDEHGGFIVHEQGSPQGGTVFKICIPLKDSLAQPAPPPAPPFSEHADMEGEEQS